MYRTGLQLIRRVSGNLMLAAATFCLAAVAHSQATIAGEAAPTGRVDFDAAKLPEANFEVDLSQDMFKDLFGIGDAAIAGVAETLMKANNSGDGAKGAKFAAEQLEAARQIIQLAGNVVREVRVRVYDGLPENSGGAEKLFKPFDEQLKAGKWESVARIHDDDTLVRVSAIRNNGALQGLFITATDGDDVVIANILCDISPENMKKLTSTATKVGLEHGLAQVIEQKMKHLPIAVDAHPTIVIKNTEVRAHVPPPAPPAPPAQPAEPADSATR